MKLSNLILTTILAMIPTLFSAANAGDGNSDRLAHAMELLGKKNFNASEIGKTKHLNTQQFILEATSYFLPSNQKHLSRQIARSILNQSNAYGFDPIFLLAFIQNESSFNANMKGSAGEIGLMQIKPTTAKWIAKLSHISYKNDKSLYDTDTNIKIGTAYLAKLKSQFQSKSDLYLSAYNMGAKNVKKILAKNEIPHVYKKAVMSRYLAIYKGFAQKGSEKDRSKTAYLAVYHLSRN
jgi:soluble lytic murein transglycosylase